MEAYVIIACVAVAVFIVVGGWSLGYWLADSIFPPPPPANINPEEPTWVSETLVPWTKRNQPAQGDYAYSNIEEYEAIVGVEAGESFRLGWAMGRSTMKTLEALAEQEQEVT